MDSSFCGCHASVFSGLIAFVGRKLVRLNYEQLKLNADFRYAWCVFVIMPSQLLLFW